MTAAFWVCAACLVAACALLVIALREVDALTADRNRWQDIARRESRLRQSADETVEALLFDRPDATVLPFPRGGAS